MRRLLALIAATVVIAACGGDSGSPAASTTTTSTTTAPVSTTTTSTSTTSTSTTTVPVATTVAGQPLTGATIVIDPGHNGRNWEFPEEINRLVGIGTGTKACNTTGTSTNDGYAEARFNWEVATRVKPRLEALGATVVLTRQDNDGWGPCIDRRAATGNEADADAVVSIHADGAADTARGFHVIHPKAIAGLTDDIAEESLRLALSLREAYSSVTGIPVANYLGKDGLSERGDLGGLNLSDVPAVFLEAGNMRNATDAALLTDPVFQDRIGDAVAAALIDFLAG